MKLIKPIWFAAVVLAVGGTLLGLASCLKSTTDDDDLAAPKIAATKQPGAPAAVKAPVMAPVPEIPPDSFAMAGVPKPDTAESVTEIGLQEISYQTNTEYAAKIEAIFRIADAGGSSSLAALGRLFTTEKDVELKAEILQSLGDIQGFDEQKTALLTAGAGADQPRQVRQAAIDGLTNIDPKYALPLLQAMTTDADEEIRESAKDAIQIVQALQAARSGGTPGQ